MAATAAQPKRLGIFLTHDPEGRVDDYILHLLRDLRPNLARLIVVANGPLAAAGRDRLQAVADKVLTRPNEGFDAGAWQEVLLREMRSGRLAGFDEAVLCNDSFFGPFQPFAEVFAEMDRRAVDFWGLTVHGAAPGTGLCPYGERPRYLQTYFLVFGPRLLHAPAFREFWETLPVFVHFHELADRFAAVLTRHFGDRGFSWAAYCDTDDLEGPLGTNVDPHTFHLHELIARRRFPVLKRRSFRVSPREYARHGKAHELRAALDHIRRHSSYDLNLIAQHLRRHMDAEYLEDIPDLDIAGDSYCAPPRPCAAGGKGGSSAIFATAVRHLHRLRATARRLIPFFIRRWHLRHVHRPGLRHAPLFGVQPSASLCRTRQERRLLDVFQNVAEEQFDALLLHRSWRAALPDLFSGGRNLARWLPLRPADTVLEIGAGCGALTGILARRAAAVTAIATDPARAFLAAVRHRAHANLEIHGGPLPETFRRLAGRTFEVITFLNPDRSDSPLAEALAPFLPLLAPGGRIFCACPNGLPQAAAAQFAQDAGFARFKIFHPRPNLTLVEAVHAPGQFPNQAEPAGPVLAVFEKSPDPQEEPQLLYTRLSTRRRPCFQIRTDILLDARGRKFVRKQAFHPAAQPHLEALCRHPAQLAELYAGSPFDFLPGSLKDDAVEVEFVAGPTLDDVILDRLLQDDRACVMETLRTLFQAVLAPAPEEFRPTPAFREVFGSAPAPAGLPCAPLCNIDLTLPNLIVQNNRWVVIDCEWTFDFPIPAGFVLYRTLCDLLRRHREIFHRFPGLARELHGLAGTTPHRQFYAAMEQFFQHRHVLAETWFLHEVASGDLSARLKDLPRLVRVVFPRLPWKWQARLIRRRAAQTSVH